MPERTPTDQHSAKVPIDSYVTLAEHFTSEDLLRDAMTRLLSRLPNVSRVQLRHGPGEFGKDIVFFLSGFAEDIPCACVVKNSPVTGNASSNNNVRTIANQAADAFDVPILIDDAT